MKKTNFTELRQTVKDFSILFQSTQNHLKKTIPCNQSFRITLLLNSKEIYPSQQQTQRATYRMKT